MIERLQGILKIGIVCLAGYLLYSLYEPDANRIFEEAADRAMALVTQENTRESSMETEIREQAELPVSYDSRAYGRGPDVRNQGSLGTCWAVTAVSGLEATLLPEEHFRFSADHISLQNGYAKSQNDGGAYTMAMAYLTAWTGPVLAEEDAYGDGYSPEGLLPAKHVQEIQILEEADREEIKEAIRDYGAVQTSLYMDMGTDDSSVYFNDLYASYCYPKETEPNHDVLIIGWDDEYPASQFTYDVKENGAYLCQNSWGTGFGDQGIFYVSYEDPNVASYCTAYSGVEDSDNYGSIYQSDLLGWVGQLGYGKESCYFANVYESRGEEQLEAVGFYAVGENTDYEIYVVDEFHSTLSLVSFSPKQTGSFRHAGFYTIPLKEKISLHAGQRFGIVIKIHTPGEEYPVATEYKADIYTETVDLTDGEGYISLNGYRWSRTETEYDCNVCLKAYTSPR